MHIQAGLYKGMPLHSPKHNSTRPSSAKIRAAVMNMLTPVLEDALFVDCFAGTGSMGFSALSLGASACIFIENNREALSCLQKNLLTLKTRAEQLELFYKPLTVLAYTLETSFERVFKLLSPEAVEGRAVILWLDPPYADSIKWKTLLEQQLKPSNSLHIVWELPSRQLSNCRLQIAGWQLHREKVYGDTAILWYAPE